MKKNSDINLSDIICLYQKGDIQFDSIVPNIVWMLTDIIDKYPIRGHGRDDLMQELLIISEKAAREFDKKRGVKFQTMLYNYCNNHLTRLYRETMVERRKCTFSASSLDELMELGFEPEAHEIDPGSRDMMLDISRLELSESERIVINMVLEEEYVADIARKLGRSRNSIYSILDRLKPKLSPLLLEA